MKILRDDKTGVAGGAEDEADVPEDVVDALEINQLGEDEAGVAGDVEEADVLEHIELDLVGYLDEGGDQEDEEDTEEG